MVQRQRNANEIIGLESIKAIVDDFYNRIQVHPTLAGPFQVVTNWPEHKERLVHFWWLSLGGEAYADYQYNVGPMHMVLGIDDSHVDDWLALFFDVMSEHIPAEQVAIWHGRATHMGRSIRMLAAYGAKAVEASRTAQ